jgi:hypothetical protein
MNEMQDLIEKTINPPGILKKNRRALFLAIKDIAEIVRKDALTAFNAHFPYLADAKKLQEHGNALLIPHLLHDTETEYRERVAAASFFLMKAGERQYIMGQLEERFGGRCAASDGFLDISVKIQDLDDAERVWLLQFLDELVNPNVKLSAAGRYGFVEAALLHEMANMRAAVEARDAFNDRGVKLNGAVTLDGRVKLGRGVLAPLGVTAALANKDEYAARGGLEDGLAVRPRIAVRERVEDIAGTLAMAVKTSPFDPLPQEDGFAMALKSGREDAYEHIDDKITVGMRYCRKLDGTRRLNGGVKLNGGILLAA